MKALLTAQGPHPVLKYNDPIHTPRPLPNHLQIQTNVAQTMFYTVIRAKTLYA